MSMIFGGWEKDREEQERQAKAREQAELLAEILDQRRKEKESAEKSGWEKPVKEW